MKLHPANHADQRAEALARMDCILKIIFTSPFLVNRILRRISFNLCVLYIQERFFRVIGCLYVIVFAILMLCEKIIMMFTSVETIKSQFRR